MERGHLQVIRPMDAKPRPTPRHPRAPRRPLPAALLLAAVLVASTTVLPAAVAGGARIHSGDAPSRPINIVWAEVDGVRTIGSGVTTTPIKLGFLVSNDPKSLTFDGVNHPLGHDDEVLILGFEGTYVISDGNVKFDGHASSWDICGRDTDGDLLEDCAEREVHGTSPTQADTDDDGLDDGAEVLVHGTDPRRADTDGGGATDGEELARETDPHDAADDRYVALHTQEGPGGGVRPIRVSYLKVNDAFPAGNASGSGRVGTLTFQPWGDQWLRANGTDVNMSGTDLVTIEDFRGAWNKTTDAAGRVFMQLQGHGARLVFFDDGSEDATVHTAGTIRTDEHGAIHVDLVHSVEGQVVGEQHQTLPPLAGRPLPVYTHFDIWKDTEDPITGVTGWTIRIEATESDGGSGYLVTIHNPDPVTIQKALPAGHNVCVFLGPPPTNCGTF